METFRRFGGETPVNIINFGGFLPFRPGKMTRLKGLALLGVLLGSFRTTYGSILEAQCRARCYTSLHVSIILFCAVKKNPSQVKLCVLALQCTINTVHGVVEVYRLV